MPVYFSSMRTIIFALAAILFAGCVTTPKINWQARIGNYTYDQAILELGPPDKSANLANGTTVADWVTERGYSYETSDYYPFYTPGYVVPPMIHTTHRVPATLLRLTFGANHKLQSWKKFYR